MDPEEKELLKRAVTLSEENNDMLRSMQRSIRLGRMMTLVYWIFIIGSAVGAYYLVQPYIDTLMNGLGDAKNSFQDFDSILDNFKQYTQ